MSPCISSEMHFCLAPEESSLPDVSKICPKMIINSFLYETSINKLVLSFGYFYLILRSHFIKSFEQNASLANLVAGHKATFFALLLIDGFFTLIDLYALC